MHQDERVLVAGEVQEVVGAPGEHDLVHGFAFWSNPAATWEKMVCQGQAKCWDYAGNLISDVIFVDGEISK